MKKLLLSACLAAACWTSDVGAMRGKTVDGQYSSITECKSRNNQFLMINRWELGNIYYIERGCKYLHIDYSGTKERFNQERSKANLPIEMRQAMGEALKTLPSFVRDLTDLRVLNVYGGNRDEICLGVLPDFVGNLKNLRILDLSDNHLETLPDSIGNLKNLEELDLSNNYQFSKLPESVGNLENLRTLYLRQTSLDGLPESMENLTNLKELVLSRGSRNYPSEWYYKIVKRSFEHWSCPPPALNNWKETKALDLSGKNLKQIPFGIHWMKGLAELDVSNNQITKIPNLMRGLYELEKLYIHGNPNLNHLPDFLWKMQSLKTLKIDGKLIKDLPEGAEYSLDNENLEDAVLSLTLDGKNNKKMSYEELSRKTGPYIVHLKK